MSVINIWVDHQDLPGSAAGRNYGAKAGIIKSGQQGSSGQIRVNVWMYTWSRLVRRNSAVCLGSDLVEDSYQDAELTISLEQLASRALSSAENAIT